MESIRNEEVNKEQSVCELIVPRNFDMGYPCGYCGNSRGSLTYCSLHAESLTCEDYQQLIDRNWRRSGAHLYIKNNDMSCCPHYTIRLPVAQFKPTSSQKATLKKMDRFLHGPKVSTVAEAKSVLEQAKGTAASAHAAHSHHESTESLIEFLYEQIPLLPILQDSLARCLQGVAEVMPLLWQVVPLKLRHKGHLSSAALLRYKISPELGFDISRRIMEECSQDGVLDVEYTKPGFLNVKLSGPVWMTIDEAIHRFEPSSSSSSAAHPVVNDKSAEPNNELKISFSKASEFTEEKYDLYRKYQAVVHKEVDNTQESYYDFLCGSPLIDTPFPVENTLGIATYGSYHMEYRLNGILICVGVVDVLPRCLSAVYCYYDPDLHLLAPGVYAALKEIELCSTLQLPFYYLGYYIHSCPKMRYKAGYAPAELLCLFTYQWVPFSSCKRFLDMAPRDRQFIRLDMDHQLVLLDEPREAVLSQQLLVGDSAMTLKLLTSRLNQNGRREFARVIGDSVTRYRRAVGPFLANKITLQVQ
jgi:arginine-tRNA-protein transferase